MNKTKWLQVAEVIDSLRIFPRLFLVACFVWSVHSTYLLIHWYTKLPDAARGLEASGFGAVALASILAFLKLVYTTYSEAGRDWNGVPPVNTSSTVTINKTETTA